MQKRFLAFAVCLTVVGCDKIGRNGLDSIPNPSPEQEQVAQISYDQLRKGNFEQISTHFEPTLKAYFIKNQKQMLKFSKALPKEDYRSKKIVAKRIEKDSSKPSLYKVTYEYAYDNNLVQYDVSFDKPNGSTLIRNLDVQIFGK